MNIWNYKSASTGELLPELKLEPVSRTNLALYACASGDHNPLHIDTDYANEIGLPDVIAHGMLIMGYLGRGNKKPYIFFKSNINPIGHTIQILFTTLFNQGIKTNRFAG